MCDVRLISRPDFSSAMRAPSAISLRFVAEDLRGGRMLVRRKLEQTRRFPCPDSTAPLVETISVTVRAAPCSRQMRRKARSVTPAIGASTSRPSIFTVSDLHSVPPDLIYGLFYHNITGNATCRMVTERKWADFSGKMREKRRKSRKKCGRSNAEKEKRRARPYLLYIERRRTPEGGRRRAVSLHKKISQIS